MVDPSHIYYGLRERFLALPIPAQQAHADGPPQAYAMLFEVAGDNGTNTLAATANGDASLYSNVQAGIIGGITVPAVREAAIELLTTANELIERAEPSEETRGPAPGEIALILLTTSGTRVLRHATSTKVAPSDPLIALIRQGSKVLTELQRARPKGIAVPPAR